jgi:hypothetical protein
LRTRELYRLERRSTVDASAELRHSEEGGADERVDEEG